MKTIQATLDYRKDLQKKETEFIAWCETRFGLLELSDNAIVDLGGQLPYFYVHNRQDLQTLMKVAPKWDKTPSGKSILYQAIVDNYTVCIFACDEALPPTCKVVKEERVIPAQPERTEIIERILCDV